MGMEALSDITRSGVSAFGASGGGGATTVTDANAATALGDYIVAAPYTNTPYAGPGAIATSAENGRVYQRGSFWSALLGVVPHERYFNGTSWTPWEMNDNAVQVINNASGVLDLSAVTTDTVIVNLTGNVTSVLLPPGQAMRRKDLIIQFTQDATGGRTVAGWPPSSSLLWQGDRPPAIASKAASITQVCLSNANNTFWIGYNTPSLGNQIVARKPAAQRTVAGAITNTALGALTLTAARIMFVPFVPTRRMQIASLGVSISTLAAGTSTLGIYAANGNASYDYPGTRLASTAQGAIDNGTTGTKTAACSYILEPGVLYFIAMISSSAAAVRSVAIAGQANVLGWTDNSTTAISYYYNAGATNVLPPNAAAPTVAAALAHPAIYLIEA